MVACYDTYARPCPRYRYSVDGHTVRVIEATRGSSYVATIQHAEPGGASELKRFRGLVDRLSWIPNQGEGHGGLQLDPEEPLLPVSPAPLDLRLQIRNITTVRPMRVP